MYCKMMIYNMSKMHIPAISYLKNLKIVFRQTAGSGNVENVQ